jgi:hypothetical protein
MVQYQEFVTYTVGDFLTTTGEGSLPSLNTKYGGSMPEKLKTHRLCYSYNINDIKT